MNRTRKRAINHPGPVPSQLEGRRLVDAVKSAQLHITKTDIAGSKVKDPLMCVVAVAARRQLHADEARIHMSRAYVRIGTRWTRYIVDARTQRELVAFDRGGGFEPGVYFLRAPGIHDRLGARQGGPGGGHKAKTHRRSPLRTTNVRLEMVKSIHHELEA